MSKIRTRRTSPSRSSLFNLRNFMIYWTQLQDAWDIHGKRKTKIKSSIHTSCTHDGWRAWIGGITPQNELRELTERRLVIKGGGVQDYTAQVFPTHLDLCRACEARFSQKLVSAMLPNNLACQIQTASSNQPACAPSLPEQH